MADLEIKMIKKFIVKEKQERYIQFVSSTKNRKKFLQKFAHFKDFDFRFMEDASSANTVEFIHSKLERLKLDRSDCYIISENRKLDQKFMSVDLALESIIGYQMGSIVVFGDADLIFYEGEGPKHSLISK